MKVNELRPGLNNVDISGVITGLSEPRQIMTKFGNQTTLTTCQLKDETGEVQLTMWGMQSDGIEEGKKVEIVNGFTKEFRGDMQLGIGKGGSIKVVE